jgi:spermidine synthase
MPDQNWLSQNELALARRLHWLQRQPNGDLFTKTSALHDIVIHKAGSQIQLIFRDPTASDVMSRLDLTDPLRLVAAYTQALMLGLIWQSEPEQVYIAGFGGGRVPLVLHHYFPQIGIECTELDPTVVELAERFFGVKPDEQLRVIIQDGRDYLERGRSRAAYDLIMLDAFRGTGYSPYRLATLDFYRVCQRKLAPGGVVLVSLLDIDPLYYAKIFTFSRSFEQAYACFYQDATVLIGSSAVALEPDEIVSRAEALQEAYRFRFPLVEVARKVLAPPDLAQYLAELEPQPLLEDAKLPPGYLAQLDKSSTIFSKARRDDPCPCESGKKYKNCHGRQS